MIKSAQERARGTVVKSLVLGAAGGVLTGCIAAPPPMLPRNPAKLYAEHIRGQEASAVRSASLQTAAFRSIPPELLPLGRFTTLNEPGRARMRFVSDELPPEASGPGRGGAMGDGLPQHRAAESTTQTAPKELEQPSPPEYTVYRSEAPEYREYAGPLSVGEPGESASLWRESRGGNDLWRDVRAWQPMDLITITIKESDEAKKDADTEVKQKSTLEFAISKLFGLENQAKVANDGANVGLDPTALISASSQNDFKGEGKAKRKDTLSAKMSAMVVEVLPSGIMRIEGQKIITMSAEEQVMVISGLVRPRDVNANNEVNSAKIAHLRIDYYGRGTVGEAQHGGWVSRLLRTVWPF